MRFCDLNKKLSNFLTQEQKLITTGIKKIDEEMPLPEGSYTVIASRPGNGKTRLMYEISTHMLKHYPEEKIAYYNCEDTDTNYYIGLISHLSKISRKKIHKKELDADEYRRILSAMEKLEGNKNFFFYESSGKDLEEILEHMKKLVDIGCKIFFFDFMQSILYSKISKLSEKHAHIAETLERFAVKNRLYFFGVAQLNRESDNGGNNERKIPSSGNMLYSGAYEQKAHNIILLNRILDKDETGRFVKGKDIFFQLDKNRHGDESINFVTDMNYNKIDRNINEFTNRTQKQHREWSETPEWYKYD